MFFSIFSFLFLIQKVSNNIYQLYSQFNDYLFLIWTLFSFELIHIHFHKKMCVDSGLWVPQDDSIFADEGEEGDEEETLENPAKEALSSIEGSSS